MKIAVSSAAFAAAFSAGTLTQLEWLDVCANELEVDGIVFDLGDFPRTDDEYLAQLKKTATDLGLTVAAVARTGALPSDGDLAIALGLGAPIAIASAPEATDDPAGWSAFVETAKTCARAAKKANVVVALSNVPQTLCPDAAGLRRIAYDVDGSWLRFALAPLSASADDRAALLAKTAIARIAIEDPATFAPDAGETLREAIEGLARFRGFVVLETLGHVPVTSAYHAAIARFADARSRFLAQSVRNVVKT